VEDDSVGLAGQTNRSGKWPRPACWAGQVGYGPLAASSFFSVLILFYFLLCYFEYPIRIQIYLECSNVWLQLEWIIDDLPNIILYKEYAHCIRDFN
jgi:hypothetical protein